MIQTNYISHATEETSKQVESWGYIIGGSVVCNATGRVLEQASWTNEDMLLIDIDRVDGTIVVKPSGNSTDRAGAGYRVTPRADQ